MSYPGQLLCAQIQASFLPKWHHEGRGCCSNIGPWKPPPISQAGPGVSLALPVPLPVFSWCSDPCGCSCAPLLSLPAALGTISSIYPALMDVAPCAGTGQVPSALTAGMWGGKIPAFIPQLQFLSSIPLAKCCRLGRELLKSSAGARANLCMRRELRFVFTR